MGGAENRIISFIGFSRKSGRCAVGCDRTLDAVRKSRGNTAVVLAGDASQRTKKQIRDKCVYYNVPLIDGVLSSDELSGAVGSKAPVSVIAVTDANLVRAMVQASSSGNPRE